jgi:hypothetical protein
MKKTIKPTAIMLVTAVIAVFALAGCNNEPAAIETAAKPAAAPEGGEVADNTPITLSSETAGAVIYYTQDGTEPGTASSLYSDTNKPRITTGKLTLKAIAVKDGMNNSAVLTAVYTILTVELIADAGEDQTVTLANDLTVALDGSGSSGTVTAYAWECTEYTKHEGVTAAYTLGEINNLITPATDLSKDAVALRKAGTYVFELTVKDTAGAEKTAEVTVEVEAMTVTKNITVNSKTITLPAAQFDFNPLSYSPEGGNWGIFDQSKLTFTLTDNKGGYTYRNDGIVEPNARFFGNPWPGPITTQTFYYDGIEITGKSRSIMLYNTNLSGFDYVFDITDIDGDNPYAVNFTFDPLTFTIRKIVNDLGG